ncbi:phosphatase PAP2 family protein [Streptomyces sp. NRRL S-87]|uniref:phosphatase PAP2 family protein n=1 Tax=Streptomyces sp. NRRL S-87 TaxID=1463920 RepID=UPI000690899E|nr:phosphatase PAP2 family protein [Streptomyces sp. NRRL S-87]
MANAAEHSEAATVRARVIGVRAGATGSPTTDRLPAARVLLGLAGASLLLVVLPGPGTFLLDRTGAVPVFLVLLVLLGCLCVPDERGSGALVGSAAALQPALLLFVPLLWSTGRRGAARATAVTFAAGTGLAWAAQAYGPWTHAPWRHGPWTHAPWTHGPWTHGPWAYGIQHLAGTGPGGRPGPLTDPSLHGALLRLGLTGPAAAALFAVAAAVVCGLGLRRAVRYAQDGQHLLAVALTGCVAAAVAPTGWQHQLLWVLLAAVGKVGTRAADRAVWPVAVALVVTLPGDMLLPQLDALAPVRDNTLLVAALAAACAVPFVRRTSPHWRRPVPTRYAVPAATPARWSRIPLPPFWRRALSRPNLLLELLLIRVGYSIYSLIRAAVPNGRALAEGHGRQIHALEGALGLDIEHGVNRWVVGHPWLKGGFGFYYTSFHFVVPLTILALLYWRRPADYRWARASLGLATVIALVGFWLYPLAPPRLMPGLGFVDTVHGPQDLANPQYGAMTAISNQYAAMPSLHFGWSLWCGVVVFVLARRRWQKAVGLVHPLVTVCAIVATANHWVLDAVGGAAVVAAGFGLVHVLSGPRSAGVQGADERGADERAAAVRGAALRGADERGADGRVAPARGADVRSAGPRDEALRESAGGPKPPAQRDAGRPERALTK